MRFSLPLKPVVVVVVVVAVVVSKSFNMPCKLLCVNFDSPKGLTLELKEGKEAKCHIPKGRISLKLLLS